MRKNKKGCKHAACRVVRRLEGSRFAAWQLYRLAAGGSRELPNAMFAHRAYSVRWIQRPIELPHVETFPGAACC
jgi:hypothetical protein